MSGQAAFDKPVKPAALCRGETAENGKAERGEETELNGVEEERDEMSDEEGDEIDGEEELAAPDWRVRAGPQAQTETKGERRARSNTRAVPRLVRTLHDGKGVAPITMLQSRRVKISQDGPLSPWIISS